MKSTRRLCVATTCAQTSDSDRFRFCSVMRALKASMPPYCTEYRGGVWLFRMSGRCFSASSSHVVTCARMSRIDQAPVTPGSISCTSDRPAYDSPNATHAVSIVSEVVVYPRVTHSETMDTAWVAFGESYAGLSD